MWTEHTTVVALICIGALFLVWLIWEAYNAGFYDDDDLW